MLNQWKNSTSVLKCFTSIQHKQQHTFIIFDSEYFCPSITEKLLRNAISFASKHCKVTEKDIDIIMHARKSILFSIGTTWIKKDSSMFDVTIGSFECAEVCDLVGLYILNDLCEKYGRVNIGLYRDDGLAIFLNIAGTEADRVRKDITSTFKKHGLNITIQTNIKFVNYLNVTINLNNGTHYLYRKPNDQPLYSTTKCNHQPSI